eukprot:scaffold3886_cov399-Prasinococcus_capsulatus_cf.AAC.19
MTLPRLRTVLPAAGGGAGAGARVGGAPRLVPGAAPSGDARPRRAHVRGVRRSLRAAAQSSWHQQQRPRCGCGHRRARPIGRRHSPRFLLPRLSRRGE